MVVTELQQHGEVVRMIDFLNPKCTLDVKFDWLWTKSTMEEAYKSLEDEYKKEITTIARVASNQIVVVIGGDVWMVTRGVFTKIVGRPVKENRVFVARLVGIKSELTNGR